jgi:hypothetical protein
MADTTEATILKVLGAHDARGLGRDAIGLMTKEVAERAKLPLHETQIALNDMAERGLVRRSMFFWRLAGDTNPAADADQP